MLVLSLALLGYGLVTEQKQSVKKLTSSAIAERPRSRVRYFWPKAEDWNWGTIFYRHYICLFSTTVTSSACKAGVSCRRPVYRRNFSWLRISFCHFLLVICASVQYVQSSWRAMCC